jgi:microcystin-dependent protein
LIGTTFGGDGESTFNLPDLRGRLPVHQGNGFILAQAGGAEEVTLTTSQIPSHTHALLANLGGASAASPANAVMAEQLAVSAYQSFAPATAMAPQSIGPVGGSQPHTNMQPYLCVDFIISLFGIYPTPT